MFIYFSTTYSSQPLEKNREKGEDTKHNKQRRINLIYKVLVSVHSFYSYSLTGKLQLELT